MEEKRTFKQLIKNMGQEELRICAKEETEGYVISELSQRESAENAGITTKAFRDLMDYAIEEGVVSLLVAKAVCQKAKNMQKGKCEEAGHSSDKHHKELVKRRNEKQVSRFSDDNIKEIATKLAEDFNTSIPDIMQMYRIESVDVIKLLLQKSIIESIVSDKISELIRERSIKGSKNPKRAEVYFQIIFEERKKKQEKKDS